MKANSKTHRSSLPFWIRVIAALVIAVHLTIPASASTPNPSYVNQTGDIVGGEPGEDPHLRIPVIVKMRDDSYAVAPDDVTDRSIYPIESFGGGCFGEDSRVQHMLDLVFHMFFDVLPR